MTVYPDSVRAVGIRLMDEGMSYSEVSRRLGASLGAVYHWHRQSQRANHCARRSVPELPTLEPGTNIAGVVIEAVLGRQLRPGVYVPFIVRTQAQLDRTLYRVRCAVCGGGLAPTSHARLMKLDSEFDVVNCVHCWRKERQA